MSLPDISYQLHGCPFRLQLKKVTLKDKENTTFIIEKGIYYYIVMPFGLKNIEATCQWLVNKVY